MSDPIKSAMPDVTPVPRDAGSSLMSEVLPVRSRTTRFWRSKVLIPALATVATTMLLFNNGAQTLDDFWRYALILGIFIVFMLFYAMYLYGNSRKPFWVFLFPYLVTVVFFLPPLGAIIFGMIAFVFRDILPGGEVAVDAGFIPNFISHFFGAGMCEELFKALPIFIMAGFGLSAASQKDTKMGRLLDRLAVRTPLDGLLAGAASGAAFISFETFGQYYNSTFASQAIAQNNVYAGLAAALQLAIPRSLQGLVGHMAWNGIFGYFIGLALRYRTRAIPLLLAGWLIPSAMHGFWNGGAIALGTPAMWLSGMTTIVFFLATLLKARQLEPHPESPREGSVVLGSAVRGMAPVSAARAPVSAPVAKATAFSPVVTARPADVSTPASVSKRPKSIQRGTLIVSAGEHEFPALPGTRIDLADYADLQPYAAGFSGEVSAHPSDASIIGLKNLGAKPWTLFSAKGVSQVVEPGRSARLEPGSRIVQGELVVSVSRAS